MFQIPAFIMVDKEHEDALIEIDIEEGNEIVKLKVAGKEYLINKDNFVRLGRICQNFKPAEKPYYLNDLGPG